MLSPLHSVSTPFVLATGLFVHACELMFCLRIFLSGWSSLRLTASPTICLPHRGESNTTSALDGFLSSIYRSEVFKAPRQG